MSDTGRNPERPDARRFWRHAGGLGAVGVIVALALGAAFMSIGHDQRPRDLPIAAVGTPATARGVEAKAPGELSVRACPTELPRGMQLPSATSTARLSSASRECVSC